MKKKVLKLTLKKMWYDLILLGVKQEEYREIKELLVKAAVRCPKSNDSEVRLWRRWIDTKIFHACPISSRL